MLTIDGTAHAVDVLAEIAERNKALERFRLSSFVPALPGGIVKGGRKNTWLHARPTSTLCKRTQAINRSVESGKALGLDSVCMTDKKKLVYIPFLDFRAAVSQESVALIREKFKTVMSQSLSGKTMPGYLLVSGRSYHYIGLELLGFEEWLEFMGLSLLFEDGKDPQRFSPTDRLWVGHALRRAYGTLRIFAGKKNGEERPEPAVVDYIEYRY